MRIERGVLIEVFPEDLDENGRLIVPREVRYVLPGAVDGVRENLTSVFFEEGTKRILEEVFLDCRKLRKIHYPSTLELIGDHAHKNCVSLRKCVIPEGVTEIGMGAYENCLSLTEVDLPSSVQSIDLFTNVVFRRCDKIVTVRIEGSDDKECILSNAKSFLKKFPNIVELDIADEKIAREFWEDRIARRAENFLALSSHLFADKPFRYGLYDVMIGAKMREWGKTFNFDPNRRELYSKSAQNEVKRIYDQKKEIEKGKTIKTKA